jgi:hypothetical protein
MDSNTSASDQEAGKALDEGFESRTTTLAREYLRHYDASVTAKALQHSKQTALNFYDAGSEIDHGKELPLCFNSVSESAKRPRLIPLKVAVDAPPREGGRRCDSFGHPEALSDHVPGEPNYKDGHASGTF